MILLRQNNYAARDFEGLNKAGQEIWKQERTELAKKAMELRKSGRWTPEEIAHKIAKDKTQAYKSARFGRSRQDDNIVDFIATERNRFRYEDALDAAKEADTLRRLTPKPSSRPPGGFPSPKRDRLVRLALEGGGEEEMLESEARRRGLV